jgi:DNA-binding NarL/FixJ family response regulator
MSQTIYKQYVKEKIDQGLAPENIVRDLRAAYPDLPIEQATPLIQYMMSYAVRVPAEPLTAAGESSIGGPMKALAFKKAPDDLDVANAAYFAWLLRLGYPKSDPLSIAEQVKATYPNLTTSQMAQVLKSGQPHVFPVINVLDLARILVNSNLGKATPVEVAQALRSEGVFPGLAADLMAEVLKHAVVFPNISEAEMRAALQAAGYSQSDIDGAIARSFPPPLLNPRETAIRLAAEGKSAGEVATALHTSFPAMRTTDLVQILTDTFKQPPLSPKDLYNALATGGLITANLPPDSPPMIAYDLNYDLTKERVMVMSRAASHAPPGFSAIFKTNALAFEPGEFQNGITDWQPTAFMQIHNAGADRGAAQRYVYFALTTESAWVLTSVQVRTQTNAGSPRPLGIPIIVAIESSPDQNFSAPTVLGSIPTTGGDSVVRTFADPVAFGAGPVYIRLRSITPIPDGSNYVAYGDPKLFGYLL